MRKLACPNVLNHMYTDEKSHDFDWRMSAHLPSMPSSRMYPPPYWPLVTRQSLSECVQHAEGTFSHGKTMPHCRNARWEYLVTGKQCRTGATR